MWLFILVSKMMPSNPRSIPISATCFVSAVLVLQGRGVGIHVPIVTTTVGGGLSEGGGASGQDAGAVVRA